MRLARTSFNLFFISAVFLISCHSDNKRFSSILKDEALPVFSVAIDINNDTVLRTPGGCILRIQAGSFEAAGASIVKLNIKEAVTISDIIMAGLSTVSNGKLLSSGGMIDIEPADDKNIQIVKPILISLPTAFLDSAMKVFKGEKGKDGKLNWTDPTPMASNSQMLTIDRGEQLFIQKCVSCHGIAKSVTGPPLAYISRSRPEKWLFDYTRNNQALMKSGDLYANCLYEQYGKTPMPPFPELSDSDLNQLYTYIENESKKSGLPVPDDQLKKCTDSCMAYRRFIDSLGAVRNKLVVDNGSGIAYRRRIPKGKTSLDTTGPSKLSPKTYPAVYYQFQIVTFGWYNIDRFLEEMNGVLDSRMVARIKGQYRSEVSVFLIVPRAKVFQQGGLIENKENEYGFFNDLGEIRMLQSAKASVIAVGEQQGQLVFDLVNFTTSTDQTLTLQPEIVTREVMNERINQLRLDSFRMETADSKNGIAIRSIDKKQDALKPKTCNCNCGLQEDQTSDSVLSQYPDNK